MKFRPVLLGIHYNGRGVSVYPVQHIIIKTCKVPLVKYKVTSRSRSTCLFTPAYQHATFLFNHPCLLRLYGRQRLSFGIYHQMQ